MLAKLAIGLEDKKWKMTAWSEKELQLWKRGKDLSVIGEPNAEI